MHHLETVTQVTTPETFFVWNLVGVMMTLFFLSILTAVTAAESISAETVKGRIFFGIAAAAALSALVMVFISFINGIEDRKEWHRQVSDATHQQYLADDLMSVDLFEQVAKQEVANLKLRTAPQEGYLPATVKVDGRALIFTVDSEERVAPASDDVNLKELLQSFNAEVCEDTSHATRKLLQLCSDTQAKLSSTNIGG